MAQLVLQMHTKEEFGKFITFIKENFDGKMTIAKAEEIKIEHLWDILQTQDHLNFLQNIVIHEIIRRRKIFNYDTTSRVSGL